LIVERRRDDPMLERSPVLQRTTSGPMRMRTPAQRALPPIVG